MGQPLLAAWSVAAAIGVAWAVMGVADGSVGDRPPGFEAQAAGPGSAAPHGRDDAGDGGPRTVTVGWAGDITPGSEHRTLHGDGRSLFADVRRLVREPDLMVGNLEGTLSVGGASKCAGAAAPGAAPANAAPTRPRTCFAFRAPPAAAGGLRWAGFDVLNLANNHSFDFGPEGRAQTLEALAEHGLAATGPPGRGAVLERRGLVVAVLGFAPYPWANPVGDLEAAAAQVRSAAEAVDLVVVTAHLGAEGAAAAVTPHGPETYLGEPRGDSRAFARAVVDAGADLVLASGPHVLRGLETYRDRLIAYSLGNFAGVHAFATAGDLALSGLLATRLHRDGRLHSAWLHALRLDASGRPSPDPDGAALRFVAHRSARDFPESAPQILPTGRVLPRWAGPG